MHNVCADFALTVTILYRDCRLKICSIFDDHLSNISANLKSFSILHNQLTGTLGLFFDFYTVNGGESGKKTHPNGIVEWKLCKC